MALKLATGVVIMSKVSILWINAIDIDHVNQGAKKLMNGLDNTGISYQRAPSDFPSMYLNNASIANSFIKMR
jgi:hypothetical protein